MMYQKTTHVPNEVFDVHLATLSLAELKILLIIIRQTYGWVHKDGSRKKRDRMNYYQIQQKTGLSRRVITQTIQSLIIKHLIIVTDYSGNRLHQPHQRKGKIGIFYAPCFARCADRRTSLCRPSHLPVHTGAYNKTNGTKLTTQKEVQKSNHRVSDWERVQEIIARKQ